MRNVCKYPFINPFSVRACKHGAAYLYYNPFCCKDIIFSIQNTVKPPMPLSSEVITLMGLSYQAIPFPLPVFLNQDTVPRYCGWCQGLQKRHLPDQGQNVCLNLDRKSTRLNSSHGSISYAVF